MASMSFKAGTDYAIKLSRCSEQFDTIAKKAIYAGSEIIADKIKDNLKEILSEEATGELVASFGITPIVKNSEGNWNAKLGFDGYDSHGVANMIKARVLESGTSDQKQPKRPFVRPAVNATKKQVINKMNQVIEEELKKITK